MGELVQRLGGVCVEKANPIPLRGHRGVLLVLYLYPREVYARCGYSNGLGFGVGVRIRARSFRIDGKTIATSRTTSVRLAKLEWKNGGL